MGNKKKNKKITVRKYYAVRIQLLSPFNVSSGQDYYTNADVLRNGSGELFIPGTSLAGAFRSDLEMQKNRPCIMGYVNKQEEREDSKQNKKENLEQESKMSSLYISDLYFDGTPKVDVRDGVMLTKEKTVDNKFDMEIIESGAQGILFLNYLVREGEKQEEFENIINTIFQDIQSGAIRIGANKNRGFGRIKIIEVYEREFKKEDVEEWLKFLVNSKNVTHYCQKEKTDYSYQAWSKDKKKVQEKYIKIQVPLKLTGGISIRRYSTQPTKADFEHITCNGKPVIPGTSWNGAIRADIGEILNSLGCSCAEEILKRWFGYVDKEKKDAAQSQIVIGESEIQDAVKLTMTRNKVNRFDASTKDGALYSETAYFGGKTCLEILIRKDKEKEYLALIGVLRLVIADIQKGYVAIGGQTAVGRGIFEEDTDFKKDADAIKDSVYHIIYSEEISEESCMSALYRLIA